MEDAPFYTACFSGLGLGARTAPVISRELCADGRRTRARATKTATTWPYISLPSSYSSQSVMIAVTRAPSGTRVTSAGMTNRLFASTRLLSRPDP